MGFASQHVFITLTKRIPEMVEWYLSQGHKPDFEIPKRYITDTILKTWKVRDGAISLFPSPHVIVGVTIGDQRAANEALPHLRILREWYPRMVIMVSQEPALGVVNWTGWEKIISWLITGGESGNIARPMSPVEARVSRDWARKNGVPFYFKQWGEWIPAKEKDFEEVFYERVGKKNSGNLLDGITWEQFPTI
jgi:protein gp37